jgi:hypothetical protein
MHNEFTTHQAVQWIRTRPTASGRAPKSSLVEEMDTRRTGW